MDEAFPILIAVFFWNCFGLSKEVSNSFLLKGLRNGSRKLEPGHPGVQTGVVGTGTVHKKKIQNCFSGEKVILIKRKESG